MADNMFSWQKGDFEKLCIALTSDSKVLFIHTRDFESPFHVLTSFSTYLTENEYALFDINASAPYDHDCWRCDRKCLATFLLFYKLSRTD